MNAYSVPAWTGPCARVLGNQSKYMAKALPLSTGALWGEMFERQCAACKRRGVCEAPWSPGEGDGESAFKQLLEPNPRASWELPGLR